jgi:hypothetical protein
MSTVDAGDEVNGTATVPVNPLSRRYRASQPVDSGLPHNWMACLGLQNPMRARPV